MPMPSPMPPKPPMSWCDISFMLRESCCDACDPGFKPPATAIFFSSGSYHGPAARAAASVRTATCNYISDALIGAPIKPTHRRPDVGEHEGESDSEGAIPSFHWNVIRYPLAQQFRDDEVVPVHHQHV